jgi:Flp pilus assembly protein TadD
VALWRQGQFDEAIRALRMAIKLDPKWAVAHRQLGLCRQARGQLDKAMAEYRRIIDLDPKGALAHNGLGFTLYEAARAARRRSTISDWPGGWKATRGGRPLAHAAVAPPG